MRNRPVQIAVLGYYGFGNVGDDLILRALVSQLSQITQQGNRTICLTVLSQMPGKTLVSLSEFESGRLSLRALPRMNPIALLGALGRADAFILGGGGLFQDESSVRSVVYYAGVVALAKLFKTPVWMWGQGLTPFKTKVGEVLTRWAYQQARRVALRDDASVALASSWCHVPVLKMADSVWTLPFIASPDEGSTENSYCIGVSLRHWPSLTPPRILHLARVLVRHARNAVELGTLGESQIKFCGWAFQRNEDEPVLTLFHQALVQCWQQEDGFEMPELVWELVTDPATMMNSMSQCHSVVAMRFHAAVLALKARKPVLGIAYSAKITRLFQELNLLAIEVSGLEALGVEQVEQAWHAITNWDNVAALEAAARTDIDWLANWLQGNEGALGSELGQWDNKSAI